MEVEGHLAGSRDDVQGSNLSEDELAEENRVYAAQLPNLRGIAQTSYTSDGRYEKGNANRGVRGRGNRR
jgi:hypothetical protein